MKRVLIVVFLMLIIIPLKSQNLLPIKWKFSTGDNPEWATADFNDKEWNEILPGTIWEDQGYSNYDGFAWYRTSVIIPSSLKKEASKNGGFMLKLGKIDDSDYTYFNGTFIGKTGELPPGYSGAYDADRIYKIGTDKILWDQPNILAIRVYDNGGGGGIYSAPVSFSVIGTSDLLDLRIAFREKDHILKGGSDVIVPVILSNSSREKLKGSITLSVKSDFKEEVADNTQPFEVAGKSEKRINFTLKKVSPGFYNGNINLSSQNANKVERFSFGVDPENVASPPDPQADFENYWIRARRELDAVDPQFRIAKIDSLSTEKNYVYLVEMRSLGNILIRGWYITPAAAGKYPAILKVQGYSTDQQASWGYFADDAISFVLNIRGHGNSRDNVNPGFPGYLQYNLSDKELYIYRGAYMDCVRAVDFLCSRPEVDASRIAVEGGSQGGALSFATAALDKRIVASAPDVPFLSDFRHYFEVADWPANEFSDYVKSHSETSWDKIFYVLSYIDIKNLAPRISCPVLMQVGLLDTTCPPHINFAAYNNLKFRKEYVVYPESGHGLPSEAEAYKRKWLRNQLALQ